MPRPRLLSLALAAAVVVAPVALAAPATAAVSPYTSCADVAAANPGAGDGTYSISPFGQTLDVYCADLATSPAEYLTLPAGPSENYGTAVADWQNWPGTTVRSDYSRVRLNLPTAPGGTFSVATGDTRFASSTGSNANRTTAGWASASSCDAFHSASGTGRADVTGTPFSISASSFITEGYLANGSITQVSPQIVAVTGGGWCGGTGPVGGVLPLTWLGAIAPYVTDAPDDLTVASGSTATFTATSGGDAPLTVAWETSDDDGASWQPVAGATTTTLTLPAVTVAQDGRLVRALFTNAEGTLPTAAARLTVTEAPAVTAPPAAAAATSGGDAVFSVGATGSPAPAVQWQTSTDGGLTWTDVSGATGPTLTLTGVTYAQNGLLARAVLTNASGTATTTPAALSVAPTLSVTTAPADTTADEGEDAVFTVAAAGDPTPTIRWQRSTDEGVSWRTVAGATGATLTVADVQASDDGTLFRAVATNAAGDVASAAAELTVVAAPAVTPAPTAPAAPDADATPAAATPAAAAADPELAATGAEPALLGGVAAALLVAGAGATVLARRARRA